MALEVVMPRLGWNMESGAISAWRKRDGETVAAGEILFEVESEKAVQDVEALESGILRIPPQSPALGVQVPVGTLLAWLLGPGEQVPAPDAAAPRPSPPTRPSSSAPRAPTSPPPSPPARPSPPASPRETAKGRTIISPRARRTAAELGIDWTGLSGTGSTGRIRERDVREAAAARRPTRVMPSGPTSPAPSAAVLRVEVDATDLAWLLREIGRGGADPAPTHGDFTVKAAAHAFESHPAPNSLREGASIARPTDIRIAIAVDGVPDPLVLPDPRPMSLRRFARESADLLARARAHRPDPRDAADAGSATLVVRDLGSLAVDAVTPAGGASCPVLGIGRIVAKQVVTDPEAGRLTIREMITLSLVLDPGEAEAAAGAPFLRRLAWFLEHPIVLLVSA